MITKLFMCRICERHGVNLPDMLKKCNHAGRVDIAERYKCQECGNVHDTKGMARACCSVRAKAYRQ